MQILRIYFLPLGVGCEGNQGLTLTDCSPLLIGCLRHQSRKMACGHPITRYHNLRRIGQNLPIQAKSSKIKQSYTSRRTFFKSRLISNSPICALNCSNLTFGHLICMIQHELEESWHFSPKIKEKWKISEKLSNFGAWLLKIFTNKVGPNFVSSETRDTPL